MGQLVSVNLVLNEEVAILPELRKFWEIENLGLSDSESFNTGPVDQEIIREFSDSVSFQNGRYCVKLPWKPWMQEALANNREIALKRFEGLVRKLKNKQSFFVLTSIKLQLMGIPRKV